MPSTRLLRTARSRHAVQDALDEAAARALIQRALAGGQDLSKAADGRARGVVWSDLGDEALVHLESVVLRFVTRFAVVSVDLETEQTGRARRGKSSVAASGRRGRRRVSLAICPKIRITRETRRPRPGAERTVPAI